MTRQWVAPRLVFLLLIDSLSFSFDLIWLSFRLDTIAALGMKKSVRVARVLLAPINVDVKLILCAGVDDQFLLYNLKNVRNFLSIFLI